MASSNNTPMPTPPSQPNNNPQQPQPQQPGLPFSRHHNPFAHWIALGVTPIALLAIALPPRRLDMRFGILGGVALWGTNQLVYDYSGTSTFGRIFRSVGDFSPGSALPEKARETQARLRAERARISLRESAGTEQKKKEAEAEAEAEEKKKRERGILEKVWMGDSGEKWKEERDRREKAALSEGGGGYWGLIVDQIAEVTGIGGGQKKEEEDEKDGKPENTKKP